MKTIIKTIAVALLTLCNAFAQAPEDLSYLTNRASFASWSLKQVDNIQVQLHQSGTTKPERGIDVQTKNFAYNGKPSLTAMAKSLKGASIEAKTPIPDSLSIVYISLCNKLPDGKEQRLFEGGASGIAKFDGKNWVLPSDASEPNMLMAYQVFIPAPGLVRAWVVDTNSSGWAVSKWLQVWEGEGFYFEGTLSGQAVLCLEFMTGGVGKGGKGESPVQTVQYVYDLRNGGRRANMPTVIAKVSIRDSEDVHEFGDNNQYLYHWVYTFKPYNSELTYGKVPLLVANYTNTTVANVWVGSVVGEANKFSVLKIAPDSSETRVDVVAPPGQNYIQYTFEPGLYHIVPLGIDVNPDWWQINDVHGGYSVGIGKETLDK